MKMCSVGRNLKHGLQVRTPSTFVANKNVTAVVQDEKQEDQFEQNSKVLNDLYYTKIALQTDQ